MKPLVKLAIGSILAGVGLVITFSAQREMLAERECTDCDDAEEPVAPLEEDVPSFIEEAKDD